MDDRLSRHDLTDEEWERLVPLLLADARQGRRWSNHRMVIDGIMFRTRAGCPWRDVPGEYGNWKSVYNRHRGWSLDGTWERILNWGRLRRGRGRGLDGQRGLDGGARAPDRSMMYRTPALAALPFLRAAVAGDQIDEYAEVRQHAP